MEGVENDAGRSNDAWVMDDSVSHEVTVVTQETSEGEVSADNALQNPTQTENSDGQNNGRNPRNDEENVACATADATVVTRQEVINETHSSEEPRLAGESVNEVNTNIPSTSEEVREVPQALLCSLQKLFPTAQSNRYNRGLYPQTPYRFTPIVNDEENDDVGLPKEKVAPPGTVGMYTPFKGRVAYPIRNTGSIDLENTCFLSSIGQYNRIGNDNRRIGLKNTGSTCYINCVIQALLATHKFSEFTVTKMFMYPYWSVLADLFGTMMFTVNPVINPRRYYAELNSVHFNIFEEHDVSEFFIYLIEMLRSFEPNWDKPVSEDARPSTSSDVQDQAVAGCSYQAAEARPKKRPNIVGCDESKKYVNTMFGGVFVTVVKCLACKNVSNRYELIFILHLSIPNVTNNEVLTIQMCLDNYFAPETLSGANRYMCNTCKCNQNARKSSMVILNERIKSFVDVEDLNSIRLNPNYDPQLRELKKLNPKVHCEESIEVPSKQKKYINYELYAVIIHRGESIKTGHYTTLTKYHNQWYLINDTEIKTVNFNDMNRFKIDEAPYMLFYRRSDIEEGRFPQYEKIPWFSRHTENKPDSPEDK